MPIYEYECRRCSERLEAMQRLNEPPLTVCPACGGELRKLISAPAFQFKGSGWYVTDYAKQGSGGGKKEGSASGGEGTQSDAGKSEGKEAGSSSGGSGSKEASSPASTPAATAGSAKAGD